MQRSKLLFTLLSTVLSISSLRSQASDSTVISLFDGKTLDGWQVTDFGSHGDVEVLDSMIVMHYGDPMTGITYEKEFPKSDYELTFQAMRIDGGDFFTAVTFPVGDEPCTLVIGGWGGSVVGLSSIDGYDASQNETTTGRRFVDNRWYKIKLRVTSDSINAWIDDDHIVDFEIDGHELSIRIEVSRNRPFGFATYNTTGAIQDLFVRKLY